MRSADRLKMCPNCDGSIPHNATVCPYCGAEQVDPETNSAQMQLFKHQSLQDSLTSLYKPPYSQRAQSYDTQQEPEQPAPKKPELFKEVKSVSSGISQAAMAHAAAGAEEGEKAKGSPIVPILLMFAGSNLCILGLLQFFFSEGGLLKLEWDASYWFIYCLISLPLLYLGYKKAK